MEDLQGTTLNAVLKIIITKTIGLKGAWDHLQFD